MRHGIAQALVAGVLASTAAAKIIRGVNLGGWLVCEPWMTPSLFNSTGAIDEWHLCAALGKEACLSTLESHWSTFYTRDDFVQIQQAGLSMRYPPGVRIPLGYWAVNLTDYEPYVSGQYPYLIQAVQWAGELGLDVFIDIHGAPGSQNGWEETGLVGPVDFLGNTSNADRTVNVLQNLTNEFMKSEYNGAVTNIELLNEPTLAYESLVDFYAQAAPVVAVANSSGINITISDGFFNPHTWENYSPWSSSASSPADFVTVDTHQFWAFPPLTDLNKSEILLAICEFGQEQLRADPSLGTPPTLVGEWSVDTGITGNSTTVSANDPAKRTWFRTVFEAQNAAFTPNDTEQASIGWYYWAWKTEYDIDAWSYRKGLAEQYIPSNVSDPSTYVFPILSNGCIDGSYNYSAPETVSSTIPSGNSSSTEPDGPSSSTVSSGGSSSTAKSAAMGRYTPGHTVWLALSALVLISVAL